MALGVYLDEFDQDIVKTSVLGSDLPKLTEKKKLRYFIHSFILEAHRLSPEIFERIVRVSIGHMVSKLIVSRDTGDKDNAYKGRMQGVRIYLDTGFLLGLLGIDGVYRKAVCSELMNDLCNAGALLCYCDITEIELEGVLETCRKALVAIPEPHLRARRIRLQKHGLSNTQIQYIIANRQTLFKNLFLVKKDFPEIGNNFSKYIDVKSLEKYIHKVYLENNPSFDSDQDQQKNRIEKDIRVLSGIYRLRNYSFPKSLAQAIAIFTTTNTGLAKATHLYELERGVTVQPIINPCVTDIFLGSLIWVQNPARIVSSSSKRILAQCYAAIQPSDQLVSKYIEYIERLQKNNSLNNEEYASAITYAVALDILQNHTLGDPNMLGEKDAEDVAKETLSRIRDEARKSELDERRKREDAENQNNIIIDHIEARARHVGRVVGKVVNWLITTIFIIGSLVAFISTQCWSKYILIAAMICCTILNIKRSWTIDGFSLWIQNTSKDVIVRFLMPRKEQSDKKKEC